MSFHQQRYYKYLTYTTLYTTILSKQPHKFSKTKTQAAYLLQLAFYQKLKNFPFCEQSFFYTFLFLSFFTLHFRPISSILLLRFPSQDFLHFRLFIIPNNIRGFLVILTSAGKVPYLPFQPLHQHRHAAGCFRKPHHKVTNNYQHDQIYFEFCTFTTSFSLFLPFYLHK